jgi:predicted nuclease of predicted toxin-antitoxin system
MPRFLIDANLPYRFALWHGEDFLHVYDLGDDMPDAAIWQYAKEHNLIIVSKDADFSDWVMLSDPPPKVIHLRIGNMRLRDLFIFLQRVWPQLDDLSATHKLVIVHETVIEYIA